MAQPSDWTLVPKGVLGSLQSSEESTPIDGAMWYIAPSEGDGLEYTFPKGALANMRYLTADLLLDGKFLTVFALRLHESETGKTFHLIFGLLNQCSARMRVPLDAVHQNRWQYPREGAWLKPMCGGDVVDLREVDRMTLTVLRKADEPVRWCMTPVVATAEEPPKLTSPVLPKGALLDMLGQSRLHEWEGKSRSAEEVTKRLRRQLAEVPYAAFPDSFSRWGGWKGLRFEGTGFFRTHHDGKRWWLVDPDGYAFWSAGLDCVRVDTEAAYDGLESALEWMPEPSGEYAAIYRTAGGWMRRSINYLAANFIRAFGKEHWYERWAQIALAHLQRFGFNTVANWSDWRIAREAGFPYVRPLHFESHHTPLVFRDFPDVFDPRFERDADAFAEQLRDTVDDPAFIGYFLMNEPTWGFAAQTPAEGMLLNTPSCATRRALADWLRKRYTSDAALAEAWGMDVRFADVAEGEWSKPLTAQAREDLAGFSSVMVQRLYETLSAACRRVDPDHLNLGARYYTVPPAWAVEGMKCFDVFSINCYDNRVPAHRLRPLSESLGMPILIGEWHFGALDVGLPASGIGRVRNQTERGRAYRVYLETAAAEPWCVGVHYFTLYDQSALGRFDGENYNIGFLDVCNKPYEPLAQAARLSHERMYTVAAGLEPPFDEPVEYLPKLFM